MPDDYKSSVKTFLQAANERDRSQDEKDFDRLVLAWREMRAAMDESSITARLTFIKHYPSVKVLLKRPTLGEPDVR